MTMKRIGLGVLLALSGSLWLLAEHGVAEPPRASRRSVKASMQEKTLAQAVRERPFPDFATWWEVGDQFATFMSEAIVAEWSALRGNGEELDQVSAYVSEYVKTVYDRDARDSLVEEFVQKEFPQSLQSGEFDALSYAFFRSAFELIQKHVDRYDLPLEAERRNFTRRVGKRFFATLHDTLNLDLPAGLVDEASFARLKESILKVNAFLSEQGYFRDHGVFRFDVDAAHGGDRIVQPEAAFLDRLQRQGEAYALFEMSYPAILPSAVYLFATVGEAQHHSSRTIEELFARVGYEASETADFDPSGYPSDMVVEPWEIRAR